ncbi:RNA-binding protein, partial [Clostridium perfringens]|nr:RNA-binding protein [Clostridium perfringens]
GIGRQLLLPMSEMPEFKPLRPQLGDSIYVKLIHDKVGRLVAKMAGEEDLEKLVFHAPQSWLNTWHEAVVYRALRKGTFFVVEGGPLGFGAIGLLHESERPTALRVGARGRVRISHVREDGRVNVTLAERKEVGMDQEAVKVFGFLKERPKGARPYSDETPADIVKQRFEMSKSAFKRAMGRLMKAGY